MADGLKVGCKKGENAYTGILKRKWQRGVKNDGRGAGSK